MWLNQFHNSVAVRVLRYYGKTAFAQTSQGSIDLDEYYESVVFPHRKHCPKCYLNKDINGKERRYSIDNGTQPMPAAYSIENVHVDSIKKILISTYWSGQFGTSDNAISFRKVNFNTSSLISMVTIDGDRDEVTGKDGDKMMFIKKYNAIEGVDGEESYFDILMSTGILTVILVVSVVLIALIALYASIHRRSRNSGSSSSSTDYNSVYPSGGVDTGTGTGTSNHSSSRRRKYSNGFQNQKESSPYLSPSSGSGSNSGSNTSSSTTYTMKSESDDE